MKGKQITQETFDATVKENIDEFQMTWEDAVADAVQQFEALGVDLQSIVTSGSSSAEGTGNASDNGSTGTGTTSEEAGSASVDQTQKYPAIRAQNIIRELRSLLEDGRSSSPDQSTDPQILEKLAEITADCNVGLAQRCLFGNHDAATLLFEACDHPSAEVSSRALKTLVALTNGQPDVLTPANVKYVMEKCRAAIDAGGGTDSFVDYLRLIRNGCVKHEANRQRFVDLGLIPMLLLAMRTHRSAADVVQLASATLRSLTLDDDIRVPFGRAHQHAQMIAAEHDGLKVLIDVALLFVDDASTLAKVLSTLSSVAVRNEFCQAIVDEGGLKLVLNAMLENIAAQAVIKFGLQMLKAIAGNDGVKNEIVKSGGVDVVLAAMSKHQLDAGVCQAGCACLAALALRSPDNCRVIFEAGGANVIAASMKVHKDDIDTLNSAYRAVTNLVNRTKEYIPVFLDLGVESLINEAQRKHGGRLQTSANALLFLLGCKAEMKELWTGEKGHLDE